MESGIRVLLLTAALALLAALSGCASVRHWFHRAAADVGLRRHRPGPGRPPRVVEPEVARRKITVPRIHSRNFELGAGLRGAVDRGFRRPPGLRRSPPPTTSPRTSSSRPRSAAPRRAYQLRELSNISLLTESERRFTYYDLSLGYNFLPGEAFIGRDLAMTSAFYLLGGIGGTDFAGDTKFTVNFGAGYRVVPTDWLAVHVHGAGPRVPVEHAGHHQAHQQPRGAHRHDRLLLEGRTMRNPSRSRRSPPWLCALPALADTGRPGAAVHPRRQGRQRT